MPYSEQRQINLGGKIVEYRLMISNRSTRARISATEEGISLILPQGFPVKNGEAFLRQNAAWILHQMERLEKRSQKRGYRNLPADVILLRGAPVRIVVIRENQRKLRARVDEAEGKLLVRIPAETVVDIAAPLMAYLKDLARQEITQAVQLHAIRMKVSPKSISVRDQRTRWGSCSSRGTLSFNWRLIMAPPAILDYVVVHELAHLLVANHSPRFWEVVAQFYPNYKEARSWLRRNAPLLHPKMLMEL